MLYQLPDTESTVLSYFPCCMTSENSKIKFPLWQYLNQPVFGDRIKLVLSPRRFAHLHRLELLERCWAKECDAKGPQQNS
ncbi:hypothetical protein BZZ01_28425 [Nostocales cyanobacterium HT-58-2]|nr:hypothetical protein BZZ01_28425 [Nostocales cyanobacterium HT-58-2]